jgi:hypothetical protein
MAGPCGSLRPFYASTHSGVFRDDHAVLERGVKAKYGRHLKTRLLGFVSNAVEILAGMNLDFTTHGRPVLACLF